MRTPREMIRRLVRRRKHRRDRRAQLVRAARRNLRKDFLRWRHRQLHHALRDMWKAEGERDSRGRIIPRNGKFAHGVLAWLS